MKSSQALLIRIVLSVLVLQLGACQRQTSESAVEPAPRTAAADFPDFGFMVSPVEYAEKYATEPVFRLKADFPKELPPTSNRPAFLDLDFKTRPLDYVNAVRDYAFEGNLPEWDPHANTVRPWYHVPWLHPTSSSLYPPNGGTEGFRGLIKEAAVAPYQLAATQTGSYQVYAITLVNEYAGYTLGRMWKDPELPNPAATDKRYGGGFPHGTVFAKLLFTDAPAGPDIPFLEHPLAWTVYITDTWLSPTRVVKKVNLLQMDIAVRDPRADGPGQTGWVFATLVYNGQLNRTNPFMNLVPLGVMWGNDPENTDNAVNPFPPKPVKDILNPRLKESVVFPSPDLPPQHLGWNSRLNGPADLNTASCLSCHIAAQYPQVTSLVAQGMVPAGGPSPPTQGGTAPWMRWFQNIPAGVPMDDATYSTDFSFQVGISLQNFFDVKYAGLRGGWAREYNQKRHVISRTGQP